MNDNKQNFIDEAIKLIELIDEGSLSSKEYSFYLSMKGKAKYPNSSFVSEKHIFWLRDIKDRQLLGIKDREEE